MGWRRIATAVASTALLASVAPVQATPAAPRCEAIGFSPRFATDRTMFCATRAEDDVYGFSLYRSTDRGRTWQFRSTVFSSDAGEQNDSVPTAIYVDQTYPSPRTVYVQVSLGLFQGDDDGARMLRLAYSPLGYPWHVTPYRDGPPGFEFTAFANARGNVTFGSNVYETVLSSRQRLEGRSYGRAVVGPPSAATRFIVPADYARTRRAVAIGHRFGVSTEGGTTAGVLQLQAFACTGDFVCLEPIADFGPGSSMGYFGSPGGLHYMTVSVSKRPGQAAPTAPYLRTVISRDDGRTWQPWTSVDRLVMTPETVRLRTWPNIQITRSPDAPGRLFLRVYQPPGFADKLKQTPVEQVFRSDDDGASWRRVAFALSPEQPGRDRGNLPYNGWGPLGQAGILGWFSAQAGGRLYTIAGTQTGGSYPTTARFSYVGPYCSADNGVHWRRGTYC